MSTPGEHQKDEDVDERHEPALRAEPGNRPAAVDRREQRQHDRREENEEPPEDRGVHHTGQEPLEELALPEHDHRLVADAAGQVVVALDGLPRAHERDQQ